MQKRRTKLDEIADLISTISDKAIAECENVSDDIENMSPEEAQWIMAEQKSELEYWNDLKNNLRSKLSIFYEDEEIEDPRIVELEKIIEDQKLEIKDLNIIISDSEKKIEALSMNNMKLQANISYKDSLLTNNSGNSILKYNSQDYYPGECNDFLISVLQQIKDRFPEDSRAFEITRSLLESNSVVGDGEEILSLLEEVFAEGTTKVKDSDKIKLQKYNFQFPPKNGHQKMIVFGDRRYTFTISESPGDIRDRKNMIARLKNIFAFKSKV